MKIKCLILILSLFCFSTLLSAQAMISINMVDQDVADVISSISEQTGMNFIYSSQIVNIQRKISISLKNVDLNDVLTKLIEGTDLSFDVKDDKIYLFKKEKVTPPVKAKRAKITGVIADSENFPLPGAVIIAVGESNNVATSDIDGNFTITINHGTSLEFSYIGYESQTVNPAGSSVLDVILKEDSEMLAEVVVTALGIKREEKALGYAVQKVDNETLTSVKTGNIATSLTGKVAGLNVKNSTEFGETSSIKLRGKEPILIIDGILYGNMTLDQIAADDIESIDILKGATASALYGARGSSGAIMVTMKRGTKKEGLTVDVSSNTMFFAGYLAFPEVQTSYSRGEEGKYDRDNVWGDKMDIGRTAVQYDPFTYEWREMPLVSKGKDNFKNILQFSLVTNNHVSISQQGEYGSFRTSLTHVYNKGQYPNQDLNKFTYTVGGDMSFGKFKLDATASYNRRTSSNENGSGYSGSYIYDLVIWGGTEFDVRDYRDYWVKDWEHEKQNWHDNTWYDNPWFKAYEVIDAYDTNMFNASLNATYEITPWLKAILKGGLDFSSEENEWRNPISANYLWDKRGYYAISNTTGFSINTDAILMADKTWGELNLNVLLGGNMYYYQKGALRSNTENGLTIPGFYSLASSVDPVSSSKYINRKGMNSLYGKVSLSWADTYFVDITARNDWSSTLPQNTRSYFYPSVAASIVLSEIIPLPEFWDFWKIRGSWSLSKKDASIYANNNVYDVSPNYWEGMPSATYPNAVIGNDILPMNTVVFEVGTGVNFFKNRLHADFAYFRELESDFIIWGGLSGATGFNYIQTNSKEERLRQGYELILGGTPIETKDFTWDIVANLGHDKYSYAELDPEYSTKKPWIKEGESYYFLAIRDWDRDPDGNIIHTNDGIPLKETFTSKVGNTTPDLVWGITNSFKYKNFGLSFTIDGRIGGMSFSRTHQLLWNGGAHIDSDNEWRYDDVVNFKDSYVGAGVKVISGEVERDPDGNVVSDTRKYAPNDKKVSYEAYTRAYHTAASNPSWQNVLDETFFKIRDIAITYNLPQEWANAVKMEKASISLTGQNLFLWAKEYKYADPDKGGHEDHDAYDYGYESLNSPSQRYVGFNIKLTF